MHFVKKIENNRLTICIFYYTINEYEWYCIPGVRCVVRIMVYIASLVNLCYKLSKMAA